MSDLIHWPPTSSWLLLVPALLVGYTVHELAHALLAFLLGDTSQVEKKRLSLNPLRHVSWMGMAAFMIFRFGWAKPVWIDSSRFRIKNQAFGAFLVSIAGSSANLLVGLLALTGMMLTVTIVWMLTGSLPMDVWEFLMISEPGLDAQGVAVALSSYVVMVNLVLALFNLLPLPPLDGFYAVINLVAAARKAFQGRPAVERAPWSAAPLGPSEQAVSPPSGGEQPLDGLDGRSPAQIHFDIGLEYQQAGQLDEAIARYRQATAHNEQFSLAYYNLGLAYWAKGRLPLAESAFRAALQSGGDRGVRSQAELRLRELTITDHDRDEALVSLPPPLLPGETAQVRVGGSPSLDPMVERRLWLSVLVGGVGMILLAVTAWSLVTMVTLMAMV